MPPERGRGGEGEVGGWKRGGGKGGREKDEEKRRKNGSFCSLFRVIPRGQINPCCLSPFRFGGEGGGGGGGKGITSTEGEWHKVENLPVVYRLVYNTGLSERPRSPLLRRFCEQNLKLLISSPALFLALQLRKSTTFSATSADLLLLFYLLSIPVSIPFEQKYVYIYIGFARPRTKHFAHNRLNREAQLGTIEKNREIQAGLLGERRVGEDLGARVPLLLISILFYFFPLF